MCWGGFSNESWQDSWLKTGASHSGLSWGYLHFSSAYQTPVEGSVETLPHWLTSFAPRPRSEASAQALENAKALLATLNLIATNCDESFSVAVDTSDHGVGAGYFSEKFNCHQIAYSNVEKEALALLLEIQQFEVYLGSSSGPNEESEPANYAVQSQTYLRSGQ